MKNKPAVFSLILGIFVGSQVAMATNALKIQFKERYPDYKVVNCKLCHEAQPKLNVYGLDLQKNAMNFELIEQLDSDGDAVVNLVEIKGNSLPGDKTSVPSE